MEKLLDRFLRYVAVDTQSDENSESQPSTAKQLNLLKMLCEELQAMGVEASLDEFGYVMAKSPRRGVHRPCRYRTGCQRQRCEAADHPGL